MATSTSKSDNEASAASDITAWYKALFGSSGTTETTTTSSNMSSEAVQALVNSMLTGSSGIAAIANATKGSGLYKSSTQQLLTNSLLSNAAAKVAAATAGTTTTRTTGASSGLGKTGTLAMLGLNAFAKSKAGQKVADELGGTLSGALDSATNYIFGSSASDAVINSADIASTASDWVTSASDIASASVPGLDTLTSYATDAASSIADSLTSSAGDSAVNYIDSGDWYDISFAKGGRVPAPAGKGYASGGTVTSLYTGSTKGKATTYTANALGSYSYADTSSVSDALTAAYGESSMSSNDDGGTGTTSVQASVGGLADFEGSGMISTLAMQNGGNWEAARESVQNAASKGISTVANMTGYGLGSVLSGLAGALGLGQLGQAVSSLVGSKAQTSLINNALTSYYTNAKQEQFDAKMEADINTQNVLADARSALGYDAIQAGYYGYDDYQTAMETQDATTSSIGESNGLGADESIGPDGNTVNADDTSSYGDTSPNDDTSGWGGFSSEDSTYACGGRVQKKAKGGRIAGDSQHGVDDVKAALPDGEPVALDGGEFVIKADAVEMIDKVFGKGFLEKLNNLGGK